MGQPAPLAAQDIRAPGHGGREGQGILDLQARPHLDGPDLKGMGNRRGRPQNVDHHDGLAGQFVRD